METVNAREQTIADYFSRKDQVVAVYLFGSAAKGRQHGGSDIDLAVLCETDGSQRSFFELELEYFRELSRIIPLDLDIVILNRAGELLSYEIFSQGKLIYERDRNKRVEFQARRISDYLDFVPLMERMSRGMMNRLRARERHG